MEKERSGLKTGHIQSGQVEKEKSSPKAGHIQTVASRKREIESESKPHSDSRK